MNLNYQQRRIFRGQGGPTDRRLPKHNARRRRKHQSNSNHDENENDDDHENENNVVYRSFSNKPPSILCAEGEDSDGHFYQEEHKNKNKGKDVLFEKNNDNNNNNEGGRTKSGEQILDICAGCEEILPWTLKWTLFMRVSDNVYYK